MGLGAYGDFASSYIYTAADGSYRIEGLAPAQAEIRFQGDARGARKSSITLRAGETVHLDVQLENPGLVAGRVVDEAGAAMAGWRVGAIEKSRPGLHHRTAITDEQGRFTLDNWPSKANALEVREAQNWQGPPALIVEDVELGREDLLLTLPAKNLATAFVVGRLRGPLGEAVADATLSWGIPQTMYQQFSAEISASSGEFRAGPMPAGTYQLWAFSPSLGLLDLGQSKVVAAQTLSIGEVRFRAPGSVRIRLVGERELLDALDHDDLNAAQAFGADGFWLGQILFDANFEGLSGPLPAGACTILLRGIKYCTQEAVVEVVAGVESEIEITLERATSRKFRVKWPSGSIPKQVFEFNVSHASGRSIQKLDLTPEPEGLDYVIVHGLGVGEYSIEVKTTDGRRAHLPFSVRSLLDRDDGTEIEMP